MERWVVHMLVLLDASAAPYRPPVHPAPLRLRRCVCPCGFLPLIAGPRLKNEVLLLATDTLQHLHNTWLPTLFSRSSACILVVQGPFAMRLDEVD